jgi:hypothetical protein
VPQDEPQQVLGFCWWASLGHTNSERGVELQARTHFREIPKTFSARARGISKRRNRFTQIAIRTASNKATLREAA